MKPLFATIHEHLVNAWSTKKTKLATLILLSYLTITIFCNYNGINCNYWKRAMKKKDTRTISVRIPESLAKQLEKLAEEEVRSVNQTIIYYLQQAIRTRETSQGRAP